MYDHVGYAVKDLDASVRFYERVLATLGYEVCVREEWGAGLGPKGAPGLCINKARGEVKGGLHLAFKAGDRAAVDAFYAEAIAAGGRDNGPPGVRKDYAPNYYAAFVLDPDGNNLEAVCMG